MDNYGFDLCARYVKVCARCTNQFRLYANIYDKAVSFCANTLDKMASSYNRLGVVVADECQSELC